MSIINYPAVATWADTPLEVAPQFAQAASVVVVGGGTKNLARGIGNRLIPFAGVSRRPGPGGVGWFGDGSTGLNTMYRSLGKVAKVVNATGLTLVMRFSTTDTSAIQYGAGELDTGVNYGETLTFNRQADSGATYGAGFLCADLRSDGGVVGGAFYGTTTGVTQYFDGKPHVLVQQWAITAANAAVCRMWVDGVELTLQLRPGGPWDPYSQSAASPTEFDYHLNNRNNRNTTSSTSFNGCIDFFARLLSNQFDGKSLSLNPLQIVSRRPRFIAVGGAAGGGSVFNPYFYQHIAGTGV